MRLTNKVEIKTSDGHTDFAYDTSVANIIELPHLVEGQRYTGEVIFKLGQLEDIEEELGIDLVTLFKALGGFYVVGKYSKKLCPMYIDERQYYNIDIKNKCLVYVDENRDSEYQYEPVVFYFKDYGKTWAFTREELEK